MDKPRGSKTMNSKMSRKLLSEKKPTQTCKDKKHMRGTESYRRSTIHWKDDEDSPVKP